MNTFNLHVTDTNLVALKSKKSAVDLGYMKDNFIQYFVPSTPRKEVVMNKGYWCRFYCIYTIIKQFIKNSKEPVQIVSLGSGLDTTPFNLIEEFAKENLSHFRIFESDLESVVKDKISVIKHHSEFKNYIEQNLKSTINNNSISGERYSLFPFDLNEPKQLCDIFKIAGIDCRFYD